MTRAGLIPPAGSTTWPRLKSFTLGGHELGTVTVPSGFDLMPGLILAFLRHDEVTGHDRLGKELWSTWPHSRGSVRGKILASRREGLVLQSPGSGDVEFRAKRAGVGRVLCESAETLVLENTKGGKRDPGGLVGLDRATLEVMWRFPGKGASSVAATASSIVAIVPAKATTWRVVTIDPLTGKCSEGVEVEVGAVACRAHEPRLTLASGKVLVSVHERRLLVVDEAAG